MKTKTILLFFVTIILLSCSNKNVENDLKKYHLKGKVKSFSEISYKAVMNSGKIVKGERSRAFGDNDVYVKFNKKGYVIEKKFYKKDTLDYREEFKYDKNDRIIEKIGYGPDGSFYWRYVNDYDSNGNKTTLTSYESDGTIDWFYTYKYDKHNHLIEETSYNSDKSLDYKITYNYDDKGNMIEKNMYKPDGSLDYRHTKTYYKNGKVIEEKIYKKSKLFWKEVNKYDKSGNKVEYHLYNSDGILDDIITYKYDDKGNEIESILRNSEGAIIDKAINQYEYDNVGNWIKKIEIPDGKPRYVLERNIEYYD